MNQGSQRQLFANGDNATVECSRVFPHPITPANKSLRGSRGPEVGVRGIPSPFIKIYERGRDTPHPSLLPLLPWKDFLDGVLTDIDDASAEFDHVAADEDLALGRHLQIEARWAADEFALGYLQLQRQPDLCRQAPTAEVRGRRAGGGVLENGGALREEEASQGGAGAVDRKSTR